MSILKLEHLRKFYGTHEVLKDINLEVAKSEVVVILGPSGCGKSTLLRCINGLESIASGAIYIDGTKIDKDFKEWIKIRQKVGMVFQSYELFEHLSVEENILLAPMKAQARPKDEVLKEAKFWLEKVGLAHKIHAYPKELSGGQKQRIAIARALYKEPNFLIFDEATSALDNESEKLVMATIESLKKNHLILIIAHRLTTIENADKIVVINKGEVLDIGTDKELMQTCELYQKFKQKTSQNEDF